MLGIGDTSLAQADGTAPAALISGSAPGESGVSVFGLRFAGGAHFSATLLPHVVCFQMTPQVRMDCRMAGQRHRHEPVAGSLAVFPAGIDCRADAEGDVDALLVAIHPGRLALAAAEGSAPDAELIARMSGRDEALFDLARRLAAESAAGYPNGPLYWNEMANGFIDNLVARHTAEPTGRTRGRLGKAMLARIKDHILGHLDEPIEVATLAAMAGRSPFHFSRVFTRAVGMTPHRYVVHLRLQRAIALIRHEHAGLAEAATRSGFADQSHLSRWVRRVHGVSLTQLAA
jgi:AraC family transcriptional regulator